MRVAGFALLGFLIGAMVGVLAALLLVILWYDLIAADSPGGDGLSGLATFMVAAPLLALAGGAIGAIRLGKSAGTGTKSSAPVVIAFALVLLVFVATFTLFGL